MHKTVEGCGWAKKKTAPVYTLDDCGWTWQHTVDDLWHSSFCYQLYEQNFSNWINVLWIAMDGEQKKNFYPCGHFSDSLCHVDLKMMASCVTCIHWFSFRKKNSINVPGMYHTHRQEIERKKNREPLIDRKWINFNLLFRKNFNGSSFNLMQMKMFSPPKVHCYRKNQWTTDNQFFPHLTKN